MNKWVKIEKAADGYTVTIPQRDIGCFTEVLPTMENAFQRVLKYFEYRDVYVTFTFDKPSTPDGEGGGS